jgi:hypothetical protein
MKNKQNTKKRIPWWGWLIIIIVIVIIIVAYVASLGTIDLTKKEAIPEEFKDTREAARLRHEALKKELERMVSLRDHLNRRFKWVYTGVRVVLVLLWVSFLFLLYYFDVVNTLEDALNYSEASFIVIAIMNFITFGSFADLKDFLSIIKTRVENWVWAQNIDLHVEIELKNQEIASLSTVINGPPPDGEMPAAIKAV